MAADPYKHRSIEPGVERASAQFPVLWITGARQTGKTTLLRHLGGARRTYVSLDDPALRDLARSDPRLFLQRHPAPVLIDEIQYAPELLPFVKMAVDAGAARGAFWLTGSQQFHAMQGITETLAGRVAVLQLPGFSWRESWSAGVFVPPFLPTAARVAERGVADPAFDLTSLGAAVWNGGYPRMCVEPVADAALFFASYLQTYLHRDVRDLLRVGDLSSFDRFLRACAARTGQLLNLSALARDVDVSVPTAKSWLSVLEASGIVHLLRPYHTNRTSRLVKAPKLYLLDTGLACHLTGWTSPTTAMAGAAAGALVETWAVGEILKSWWATGAEAPLHHFRSKDGVEIDLLIEVDGRIHPVEIKRSATVRREWAEPFATLDRLGLPRGEGAVLCLAPDEVPIDERTTALPFGAL
ncbi:MAG: ATP-binding protein [Planctomycetes bacterium]|nr:ATP-binding protein [Planctomycetota bacterium]